jgi:hypothetical protein
LTTIAGLTPTTNNVIQSVSGAWASRTAAQLKATLALVKGDVGLGNVDNTSDLSKPISTATQTALDAKQPLDAQLTAIAGLAPVADRVPYFTAATTASLATLTAFGRSLIAAADAAATKTLLALTKSDVGLGNVDNTSDASKPVSTAQATANTADRARANHTGTQLASTVSDFAAAADARIAAAEGVSIASLVSGKVPSAQIPAIGLVSVQTAASEVAMLALVTQEGDVVVRTDENKTYMRNAGTAGTMADFTLLNTPTDAVISVNGETGVVVLDKADVGLGNVDNTSDTNKPISTATQTALDAKQPLDAELTLLASLAETTNNVIQSVSGAWASRTPAQLKATLALVKGDVGLGNVDNTSDAAKPVSTATQTALDAKQPLDSELTALAGLTSAADRVPYFTGLGVAALATFTAYGRSVVAAANAAAVKTLLALTKADVGLGNVDNTSDANKPVSTAQQTELNGKVNKSGDVMTGELVAPGITAYSAQPRYWLNDTDAGLNERHWAMYGSSGVFSLRGISDDFSTEQNYMAFDRLGLTVVPPTFPGLAGSGTRVVEASSTGLLSAGVPLGAVLIDNDAIPITASYSMNDVFSSLYTDYLVVFYLDLITTGPANMALRFRAGGVDDSTAAGYPYMFHHITSAAGHAVATSSASAFTFAGGSPGAQNMDATFFMFIGSPFLSTRWTTISHHGFMHRSGVDYLHETGGGARAANSSFDGFTLLSSAGNFSGNVKTYGLRDS